MDLQTLVTDFAIGLKLADGLRPMAINQRSKDPFQPGIGPYSEAGAISLVLGELSKGSPDKYEKFATGVRYPKIPRQKCDLCIGEGPDWDWAIEVKLLRFLGDNGRPNDNILMHLLSPYPSHRSALTDCSKLLKGGLSGQKAVLVYGFDHDNWSLDPAIDAFEVLARSRVNMSSRAVSEFSDLIHPIHSRGRVFAWEILS